MAQNRYTEIVRFLGTVPSRRAVNRALAGLTVGTLLAPLLSVSDAAAGGGHKGHHHRKKKKHKPRSVCPKQTQLCTHGEFSECCGTQTDSYGEPLDICTECGCCAQGSSKCCLAGTTSQCCGDEDKCCFDDALQVAGCCGPNDVCCGTSCCPKGTQRCGTCPSGQCGCCPTDYACCPGNQCCRYGCCENGSGCAVPLISTCYDSPVVCSTTPE